MHKHLLIIIQGDQDDHRSCTERLDHLDEQLPLTSAELADLVDLDWGSESAMHPFARGVPYWDARSERSDTQAPRLPPKLKVIKMIIDHVQSTLIILASSFLLLPAELADLVDLDSGIRHPQAKGGVTLPWESWAYLCNSALVYTSVITYGPVRILYHDREKKAWFLDRLLEKHGAPISTFEQPGYPLLDNIILYVQTIEILTGKHSSGLRH